MSDLVDGQVVPDPSERATPARKTVAIVLGQIVAIVALHVTRSIVEVRDGWSRPRKADRIIRFERDR